jgi:signal transduction histidine kinase
MVIEEPSEEIKETLEILDKEILTSEMIITSLLDYAKPKASIRKNVKLDQLVEDALNRIDVPANIEVFLNYEEDIPSVIIDPVQITRAIINLARNAVQAMPEGGRLSVSASYSTDGVSLSITDTGIGMSKETQTRLFEPLFTTKTKGIGLGLVIIKSFVEAHGGSITVQSSEGEGSSFTILLPVGSRGVD